MSANMTAPEQIDGLEKLLALANLRPENIIAAQKAVREQLQLTQTEQGKVAEAKSYIAKHASLAADLQRREDELAANMAIHLQAIKDFKIHSEAENIRVNDIFNKLNAREKEQAETDKRHADIDKKHAKEKIDNEQQNREAIISCQKAETANSITTAANIAEAARLKEWESTLKRKAELARQQMANF